MVQCGGTSYDQIVRHRQPRLFCDGVVQRCGTAASKTQATFSLEIPHVGMSKPPYIYVADVTVEDRDILVVHNSRQKYPQLLGRNVLSSVPKLARCLEKVTVAENFRFARVADRKAVCVPVRPTAFVHAVEGRMGKTAIDVDLFSPLALPCAITRSWWQLLSQPRTSTG